MISGIPEDVRRFLLQSIDSVEQLEILLLLQSSPATDWSPEAVAGHLYSNPGSVARRLAALQARELLTTNDLASTYRYRPGTPDLDATITRLADVYRERRVAVITAIASKPMENVRAFSDAFKLRKKDQE